MLRRGVLILILIAASSAAQDERDEEFINALMARGYYDLLEVQYNDWLSAPPTAGLKPERAIDLKHGLIRLYTEWAEASTDLEQKKELWNRAMKQIDLLLAARLSSRDRVRCEIDQGIIFLNKGAADIPSAASGDDSARARVEQNLNKSANILRQAQEEATRLLEESFALGGAAASETRRDLIGMTLEAEFRLAWAVYGLGKVAPAGEEKSALLLEAEKHFTAITQNCPGTSAAEESYFGIALCRYESHDLAEADSALKGLLRSAKGQEFRKKIYYYLALVCHDRGALGEAADAANAALRITPGTNSQIENGCRLLIAKCLYGLAAKGKGPTAEKQKEEAVQILKQLDSLGGYWAAAARQVMIARAGSEGGHYKELAEAEAKMQKGDYSGALENLDKFASLLKGEMDPGLRAELFYKMGLCQSGLEDYGKAAESFEAASRAGGSADQSARAAYLAAVAYGNRFSKTKDRKDGHAYVASLKDLLRRFPDHSEQDDVRYRLARILEENGDFEKAAAGYEQIERGSPLRRRAADRAADCLQKILQRALAEGKSLKAEKDLIARAQALFAEASAPLDKEERGRKEGREANAIAAGACVQLARLYLGEKVNQPEAALKLLEDFEEKYPDERDALEDSMFVRARATARAGKLNEGLAKLREAQAAFPKSQRSGPAAVTLALGFEMRAKDSKGKEAAEARKTAAELFNLALTSPGCGEEESIQMWLHLAELYAASEDWGHAREAYLKLKELYPNALNVREGLARCYTGTGEPKKALEEWRVVEQASEPGSEKWWEAKYMIVWTHYKMRNYQDVLKIISLTKALRPSLGGPEMSKKFLELEKRCK